MTAILRYTHHRRQVAVQANLKGRHREYCLCYQDCVHFKPDSPDNNCPIANFLFAFCKLQDMVVPVWECPQFLQMIPAPEPEPEDDRPYSRPPDGGCLGLWL